MIVARADWIDDSDSDTETRDHKNDIWYENGSFAMCEGKESYAQTIEAVIKTIYGELQTNREYGIPYFDTIWANARLKDRWASYVRRAVSALPFVESINSFTYDVDSRTYDFNYSLTVTTTDGTTATAEG